MFDSITLCFDKEYASNLHSLICKIESLDIKGELLTLNEYDVLSDLRMVLCDKLVLNK